MGAAAEAVPTARQAACGAHVFDLVVGRIHSSFHGTNFVIHSREAILDLRLHDGDLLHEKLVLHLRELVRHLLRIVHVVLPVGEGLRQRLGSLGH